MQRAFGRYVYSTSLAWDDSEGWTAVELWRQREAESQLVARVVFWDAVGEYAVELKVSELPLPLVEAVIAEAREKIRIR